VNPPVTANLKDDRAEASAREIIEGFVGQTTGQDLAKLAMVKDVS
jgi:hypothetical protein